MKRKKKKQQKSLSEEVSRYGAHLLAVNAPRPKVIPNKKKERSKKFCRTKENKNESSD
tara:strand:- start:4864 stop:5037 length:174 start_codon:yes stop_codon:yes gene_type:complete